MSRKPTLRLTAVRPDDLGAVLTAHWQAFRDSNPDLWSPFFDLRYVQLMSRFAPKAGLLVAEKAGKVAGFLPFQGDLRGLIRPLGAPLADQHGLIAPAGGVTLGEVMAVLGRASFRFSGLVGPAPDKAVTALPDLYLVDMSDGVPAYLASRQAAWSDHFKKLARRERKGERDFGPIRVACGTQDMALFDTLVAWKRRKYRETGRHDVLGVPWIQDFLRALLESPDPLFRGEIAALWFGDRLAAIEFGMRGGDVLHSWFPVYDHEFSSVSPGVMLMDRMIIDAGNRGLRLVDLGAGHGEYKKHVSNRVMPTSAGLFRGRNLGTLLGLPVGLAGQLLEKSQLGRVSELPGKFGRRLEMILAAEPTVRGRLRGIAWAARDMTGRT